MFQVLLWWKYFLPVTFILSVTSNRCWNKFALIRKRLVLCLIIFEQKMAVLEHFLISPHIHVFWRGSFYENIEIVSQWARNEMLLNKHELPCLTRWCRFLTWKARCGWILDKFYSAYFLHQWRRSHGLRGSVEEIDCCKRR